MSSFAAPSTAPPTPPTSLTIFDDTFATLLTEATSYYDKIVADSEKASNPYLEQSSSPLPRKSISQTPYYVLPTSSTKIVQFSPILFPPPTATLQTLPTALSTLKSKRITIILLRSGSLSYGIYTNTKKTHHKSQKRYTVRKGQGGTQSSADSGKTIKSIGSQLRRDGEKKLREDCKQIPVEGNDVLVIGCSKVLRKGLLEDIGSPPSSSIYNITGVWEDSQKGVDSIWSRITSVVVREKVKDDGGWNVNNSEEVEEEEEVNQSESESSSSSEEEKEKPKPIEIPYTALHLLCLEGGTPILPSSYLDFRAGPQLYTPLHAAASVNNVEAVRVLMEGGGSPILEDGRGRKVWDVCLGGGVKDFLRRFRGENGEKWDWAVTRIPEEIDEEVKKERERKKKEKEKEKKRKQKERKKKEKEDSEKIKAALEKEEAEKERVDQFKREKVHLKSAAGERQCDFCGKEVRFAKDLFKREEWRYCSSECTQKHRREIMAKAAEARFG